MDIVERLRKRANQWLSFGWGNNDIFDEAADEIERLQEEIFSLRTEAHFDDQALGSYQEVNERLEEEIKRLREALHYILIHCKSDSPPNAKALILFVNNALKEGE
jgi:hypothetical protein